MKRLFKSCFFLLFSGLFISIGLAQPNTGRFRFEHITVDDGLAHSDVLCAEQDEAGFIWIGTNSGINRYDGYELKKYSLPVNSRNGLSGNRIRDLYNDSKNRLWVGAESGGLYLFITDHDRFTDVSQLARPGVNHALLTQLQIASVEVITADGEGRIWAGTRSEGLFVLTLNAANQVVHIDQVALSTHTNVHYGVSALVTDRNGTIWIGTSDRGLWSIQPSHSVPSKLIAQAAPLTAKAIRALHVDWRGDFWIGTDRQIFWVQRVDRQNHESFSTHPLPQSVARIQCITLDSFGHLWVGTILGLHMWESKPTNVSESTLPLLTNHLNSFLPVDTDPFNINSGRIHQIFEDRNQTLWLSTAAGGLNKVNLRYKPFTNLRRRLTEHPTLTNNFVNAILKDETRECLWIGTLNGFSRYDLTTKTYRNYAKQPLPGDATGIDVSALCQASDGTLWVSTRYHGLLMLKGERLTAKDILDDRLSLRNTRLESIVEDRFGTIWIASFELGLLRFNRKGQLLQRFHVGNSSLPTNCFTFLLYDKEKDLLWASTQYAGVLKLKVTANSLQVLKQFNYKANDSTSLSVNYAWPLLKDHQGHIWIGTIGGGLNQLITKANGQEIIRRFNQKIPISDVESILEDKNGQLWMGGTGLVRFDPSTGQWISYVVEDGIQSNSFKVGSAWKSEDGTLYFGGIKGITYFQPQQIKPNPYAPVVRITGLRIFNKLVGVDEPINGRIILSKRIDQTTAIKLTASDNDFSLDFVGLNYANTRKHTYAYRLIGYTDDWMVPAPGNRTASFANLPAGDYTFEVKANNGEGKWSEKPVKLYIHILPPWYKTWLAYMLYILGLIGALVLYRRITLTQHNLKNTLALEKFQAEKIKEVTDLKLRFFTNISHELRTPLTLILGPMEEMASSKGTFNGFQDKVSLMHQQTRKLLDLVNQLMEFRKVESGHISLRASKNDIIPFIMEIFLIFRLKAEELQLDYAIEAPSIPAPVYFDPDKLEIVLTNLLSNALKFTPVKGRVRLLVSVIGSPEQPALLQADKLTDNYLEIIVRDWGVGMRADEVNRIFDSYYQASHTETMRIMGTGIGLSLVKQFVEIHAGEVKVKSEPNVGTEFTIRLPFGHTHLSPTDIRNEPLTNKLIPQVPVEFIDTGKTSSKDNPGPNVGAARILVVEDNNELRSYLEQLLEPVFTVFSAVDGIDGWEKSLNLLPNLIVSDVMMPNGDGLALCGKIKQHPKTAHIPVILLTARVAAIHEMEGLEMGADEYMAKPFNPNILLAKIAAILQGRHQLKEYYQRQILLEPTELSIPDNERQLLEKAMAIVEANLCEPDFKVPTLVREMGMSQSALYRQIKAITGKSVVEFIKDVRMKRAAQLLNTGKLRVSEVAAQVGMEDLDYFRKTFQSVFNMSPTDYAKQHQSTADTI